MKIRRILFLVLLLFSLAPMLTFGAFMIYENDQRVEQVMRENLAAFSGTQILDLTNFCEARKEKLEIIARLDLVHDIVSSPAEQVAELSYLANMLLEWKENSQFVESLSIIDRNFRVVASSEAFDPSVSSGLEHMKERFLSGEFFISNIIERMDGGQIMKTVAAVQGIFEKDELIGYVVEEISPSFFEQNRTNTNLWSQGTLYLMDGNETLITAGTPGEASREQFVTSEEEREDYLRAWNAIDLEAHPSGEFSYSINGIDYITYYSDIDYTDWTIRVSVNLSVYQSSKYEYRVLLLLSCAVISLLIVTMNAVLAKRLTKPIENIARTLRRIQDGQNYSLRIENCGRDELGELAGKINLLLDYIEQQNMQEKEAQRRLALKTELDPLTGVKNKAAIEEYLLDAVQQLGESGESIAVAFVDIDDFKNYNTQYGHQEGDRVLRFVSAILERVSGGVVGRNGGDEFLVVIKQIRSKEALEQRAQEIMEALHSGFSCQETGEKVPIPCSIGIVLAQGTNLRYSSLLRSADQAMYSIKHAGKSGWRVIDLSDETDSKLHQGDLPAVHK